MIKEFLYLDELPSLEYRTINHPFVFIGCNIKSLYDEKRIESDENYKPQRIYHCEHYLYGSIFEPLKNDSDFIKYLNHFQNIDLYGYGKILNEYSMTCEENFGFLENGLYPVDPKYIRKYISDFNSKDFFVDDVQMPMYQRIKSVNMFYLLPEKI